MIKYRPIAVAALAVAAGLATALTGTPAEAAAGGPSPITTWLNPVKPHKATWVNVHWTTGRKICDAEVRVEGDKVDVSYPSNTDTYSSFSQSDSLRGGHVDRTAVNVTAHYGRTAFVPLEATITYTTCKSDAVRSKTFWLTLPVLKTY
ncbi:hypothetical protein ACPCHT_31850 [Nucisporomicrobium flavum]|uniref:hypothetical protein n=1 Tax=Nucisporomicrobium flavum TaxID=2785915 RepID=UPI0018F66444|nr:hypothetical protein [Nucisporomicrobium flavum]